MDRRIVYYHGCFVDFIDPETGKAVVNVLEKNRFRVEVPELVCCSFPLLNSGNIEAARKRANKLIDILAPLADEGCDIIYSCPTCGYSLEEAYPLLLDTDAARLVAEKSSIISTYLLDLNEKGELNLEFKETPLHVGYHTPCHLRSQDLATVSLELIKLVPGVEAHHLDRGCCGMGGTWALRSKERCELSAEIGSEVFDDIKETNPDVVSTDCGGCTIQIARQTGRSGDKMIHPIRILADAYS